MLDDIDVWDQWFTMVKEQHNHTLDGESEQPNLAPFGLDGEGEKQLHEGNIVR